MTSHMPKGTTLQAHKINLIQWRTNYQLQIVRRYNLTKQNPRQNLKLCMMISLTSDDVWGIETEPGI